MDVWRSSPFAIKVHTRATQPRTRDKNERTLGSALYSTLRKSHHFLSFVPPVFVSTKAGNTFHAIYPVSFSYSTENCSQQLVEIDVSPFFSLSRMGPTHTRIYIHAHSIYFFVHLAHSVRSERERISHFFLCL